MVRTQHLPAGAPGQIDSKPALRYNKRSYRTLGLFFRPDWHTTTSDDFVRDESMAARIINNNAFFKVMLVRHPWDRYDCKHMTTHVLITTRRLLSAFDHFYVDECKRSRDCFSQKLHLPLKTDVGVDVTLTEVLHAIYTANTTDINPYFQPQTALCEVDSIPYSYIADVMDADHVGTILAKIQSKMSVYDVLKLTLQEEDVNDPIPCDTETVELAEMFVTILSKCMHLMFTEGSTVVMPRGLDLTSQKHASHAPRLAAHTRNCVIGHAQSVR